MAFKNVFVTVGTTEFNQLIEKVCSNEIIATLKSLGCKSLTVQHGRGPAPNVDQIDGLTATYFDLKPSITDDIQNADLVISHAGAGSCIEVLRAQKPRLLVVINESLMDNHQLELAEKLQDENYLLYTTVEQLAERLSEITTHKFKEYEAGNVKTFVERLDQLMGF